MCSVPVDDSHHHPTPPSLLTFLPWPFLFTPPPSLHSDYHCSSVCLTSHLTWNTCLTMSCLTYYTGLYISYIYNIILRSPCAAAGFRITGKRLRLLRGKGEEGRGRRKGWGQGLTCLFDTRIWTRHHCRVLGIRDRPVSSPLSLQASKQKQKQ